MIKEFKEFIFKGNVIDLAVGVIIGSTFSSIVTSLVNDIIMPIVSVFMGGINFSNLKYVITPASLQNNNIEVAIKYGNFIQNILNFLIIGFCIFLIIKSINKLRRKKEANAPVNPTTDQILTEIRDLLKQAHQD